MRGVDSEQVRDRPTIRRRTLEGNPMKLRNARNALAPLPCVPLAGGIGGDRPGAGLFMVDLGYYDPWYRKGPDLIQHRHPAVFAMLLPGLAFVSPPPGPLPTHKPWERISAHLTHWALYLLLFTAMISGYLIAAPIFLPGCVQLVCGSLGERPPDRTGRHRRADSLLGHLGGDGLAPARLAAVKHHLFDRETPYEHLGLAPRAAGAHPKQHSQPILITRNGA